MADAESQHGTNVPRGRLRQLEETTWHPSRLGDRTPKGRLLALVRVVWIVVQGVHTNKIPIQAASLSYYTLMSLGPLIAVLLTVSGFVLQRNQLGTSGLKEKLNDLIQFVAPATQVDPLTGKVVVGASNAQLDSMLDSLVNSASSGQVGAVGLMVIIGITILLMAKIETTFNGIWGVRKGRTWVQRFFFYWSLLTLSAILGTGMLTLFTASTLARFVEKLPFWETLAPFLGSSLPLIIGFLLLSCLLALFNRFMPNTRVDWRAAFGGGLFVAALIMGNNALAIFYVQKVVSQQSLFGSVGIVPVLMFGLYLFWLFVLLGGQLTYALQNADFLANQRAWENLGTRTRQSLCAACLVISARRFTAGQPGPTVTDLSNSLRVPGSIINECLTRLQDLRLITSSVALEAGEGTTPIARYQPARPLEQITLGQLRDGLETWTGGAVMVQPDFRCDGAIATYAELIRMGQELPACQRNLRDILRETTGTV